jgi:enterochelin esterase-like enzyme
MDQKYLKRTIKRESFMSRHLDMEKKVLVYLPPNFDENTKYPALFLHDGDDYFSFGRIATQANQLIYEQKIEPIIMVAIPVDKKLRSAEYSPAGERNDQHISFVTDELLPFVQERYPIKDENLVIGGSSLGAAVSLHIALGNLSMWNKVLAQSGAFFPETVAELNKQDSLDGLTIYQSIGLKETKVETHIGELNLVERNREVASILRQHNANVRYEERDGDHTWGLWQPELPEVLIYFFGK